MRKAIKLLFLLKMTRILNKSISYSDEAIELWENNKDRPWTRSRNRDWTKHVMLDHWVRTPAHKGRFAYGYTFQVVEELIEQCIHYPEVVEVQVDREKGYTWGLRLSKRFVRAIGDHDGRVCYKLIVVLDTIGKKIVTAFPTSK